MRDKMPCDDKLKERGCCLASICNLCGNHEESTFHLFFLCSYSTRIWIWLASILQTSIQITSAEEVWNLCNRGWLAHCQLTVKAAIIFTINAIWYSRNVVRFKQKKNHPLEVCYFHHHFGSFYFCWKLKASRKYFNA